MPCMPIRLPFSNFYGLRKKSDSVSDSIIARWGIADNRIFISDKYKQPYYTQLPLYITTWHLVESEFLLVSVSLKDCYLIHYGFSSSNSISSQSRDVISCLRIYVEPSSPRTLK